MIRDTELAGLCQTIARDTGLEVTVGGEGSFITPDGKRLNIAAMPMTPEGRLVAVGLAWHEVGHKLYTDMEGGPGNGLLGELVNVIEDVREERDFILDRPGAAYDLDAVTTYYVSKGHMVPKDIVSAVISLTMGYGRTELLGQKAMQKPMEMAREIIEENLDCAFLALIEGILKTFHSMPNGKAGTEVSKEMARRLVQLLKDAASGTPPSEPSSQQQDTESDQDKGNGGDVSGKQDDDTSGSQKNGTGDDQDDQSTESEKDKGMGEGNEGNMEKQEDTGKGSGQPQEEKGDGSGQNGQATVSEQDMGNAPDNDVSPGQTAIEQSKDVGNPGSASMKTKAAGAQKKLDSVKINKMIEEGAGDFGNLQTIALNELDAMSTMVSPEERKAIPLFPRVDRIKPNEPRLVDEARCITTTSRMRSKLMGLLQAIKRLPERYGFSGRKLAVNRLVRMAAGDPRIFRKKNELIAVNTAVVVLLDRSGSMDHVNGSLSRITIARNAAFALHHALSGIAGVVAHSVAFETNGERCSTPIKVLCNWHEKPLSEHFGVDTGYCTPTPWALWYARAELLARPEPRKIVLLVTDGKPEGWHEIEEETHAATARLYRDGIEVAAIGIETDTVEIYWRNNRVINDIDELPQAMFGVMTDLLTRKAA